MTTAKKRHSSIIVLTIITSILFLMFFNLFDASAQYLSYWSEQKKIPAYEIYNNEQPPYLVADQNHKVYAFNSQFEGETDNADSPKAIFYREWTLSNGWTFPNDIFADPDGNLELLGVSSDDSTKVHLIFQKNLQDIYYSEAFLANASDPRSWSAPVRIGEESLRVRAGLPNVAAISSDKDGKKIIVIYSGSQYGSGLYFTYSTDSGNTWTEPYPLYLTGDETMVITSPSLYVGKSGFVHAVWSTYDAKGFGGPGYYARFDFNSGSWSEPMELDQPGIRHPSVIEYNGDVFVSYHHRSTNGRWWRRSSDGGQTWTDPIQFSVPYVGTNGGVSFVVDGNELLHAFFGGRTDVDSNHGMWQAIWMGTTWSPPAAVVKGQAITDIAGGNGFDPTFARAIVSNGNVVLVTWGSDGGVGTNGAWYSYSVIEASESPSVPLPIPTVLVYKNDSTPENNILASTTPPSTHVSELPEDLREQNNSYLSSPQIQIVIEMIPVVFLIAVLFVRVFYKRNQ